MASEQEYQAESKAKSSQFEKALIASAFIDQAEYLSACLAAEEIQALLSQRQQLQDSALKESTRLETLSHQLAELQASKLTDKALAQVEEDILQLQQKMQAHQTKYATQFGLLQADNNNKKSNKVFFNNSNKNNKMRSIGRCLIN
ncbi:hypothetical protein [Psychromonas sp. KJ10-2]|uniref:hypothetical protein n=1 Tax=Psychromonas sp. KJ10-2 TaxID=3391822 RepID=UPI0039B42F1F